MVWVPLDVFIDTLYRRVVPLYSFDKRQRPFLSASAVPFESGDVRFLITAAHACLRGVKPIPLFVYGEHRIHALTELRGAWEHHRGSSPDLDVAVIALDSACADDLWQRHWPATPEDVGVVAPKTPGVHYLVAGYPASRNRRRPPQFGLPGRATALVTGEICSVQEVPGVDKVDDAHFALSLPHQSVPSPGGGEFRVPRPRGMSGGGIWRLEIDTVKGVVGRPFLVGIGIEYHQSQKTFIATRIQAVPPLARDLVHRIAGSVRS